MNKRLFFGIFLIIAAIFYLLILGESFGQLLILIIGIYFFLIGASKKYRESKKLKSKDTDTDAVKYD